MLEIKRTSITRLKHELDSTVTNFGVFGLEIKRTSITRLKRAMTAAFRAKYDADAELEIKRTSIARLKRAGH